MPALLPYNNNNKGFTLIEVVMATFIIAVGTLGVFGLLQRTISANSATSSRMAASYLAQEGIENVRNQRDSNWLKQRSDPGLAWDDGIVSGDWSAIDKFERRTIITKPQPDKIVSSVEVKWPEPSGTSEVFAETELYDWR
jgi:prepilin-type N-terminal cleavage/methylation domain-containing protein